MDLVESPEDTLPPAPGPSLKKRYAKGIFWSVAASFLAQFSAFLCNVIINARLLGRDDFGRYSIILTIAQSLTMSFGMGLFTAVSRSVAHDRDGDPLRAARILKVCFHTALLIGSLLSALIFLLAPVIALRIYHQPTLTGPLRWASPYIVLAGLNFCQMGALAGLEAFAASAKRAVIPALTTIALVPLLTSRFGLAGAAIGLTYNAFANCVALLWAVGREAEAQGLPRQVDAAWSEWRVLPHTAAPGAIYNLIYSFGDWAGQAILNHWSGVAAVGLFGAANALRKILLELPKVTSTVVQPILSNMRGNASRSRQMVIVNAVVNLLVCSGVAALLYVLSPLLFALMGKSFDVPPLLTGLILVATVLFAVAFGLGQTVTSAGKMWWHVAFVLPWTALLLGLTRWWAPSQGAIGFARAAAWTSLYALLAYGAMNVILLSRMRAAAPAAQAQPPKV